MNQPHLSLETQRAPQSLWRAFLCLCLFLSFFDFGQTHAQEKAPLLIPTYAFVRKVENESQNLACPGSFSAELRKQSLDHFMWRKEASVAGVEAWTGVDGLGWAVAEVKFSSLESRFKIWRNSGSRGVRFKAMECGQFVYEDSSSERTGPPELARAHKASFKRPQVFYSWSTSYPDSMAKIEGMAFVALQGGADFWIEYDPATTAEQLANSQAALRDAWTRKLIEFRKAKPALAAKATGSLKWLQGWSLALEKRWFTRHIPSVLVVSQGNVFMWASPEFDEKKLRQASRPKVKARAVSDPTKSQNRR
ncbi:MAG TPA: hypothetical protein PLZ57_04745 [Pseudobdellovibrionaceae bacterium]|nr:hypothetical protein [Pseudobdellovibrionaceae bacterium]